jgi:hypothetical protein
MATSVNRYHLATGAHATKKIDNIPSADYGSTIVDTANVQQYASLCRIHTDPQVGRIQTRSVDMNIGYGVTL